MSLLKNILKTFICVLAGVTMSATLFLTVFSPKEDLSISLLWQIIIMSAVCSCGNLIYCSKEVLSKKKMKIRIVLHYIFTNVVVVGGGYLFEWMVIKNIPQIIVMFLLIAIVYTLVMIFIFRKEEKTAENLNQRLRKYYPEEENNVDS